MSDVIKNKTERASAAISQLRGSTLFNLSLSSIELFHTNFLYWLGQAYPAETGKLFSQYLKNKDGDTSIKSYREKKNIDWHLYFKNNEELIIENKVKSVPGISQLEQYTAEHLKEKTSGKKNFLLLSLVRPDFAKQNTFLVSGVVWHFLDYKDLCLLLKILPNKIGNDYHREIIEDYIVFASALHEISEIAKIDFQNDRFDFNNDEIAKWLGEIRLDSIYFKIKYALIAQKLAQDLSDHFPNMVHLDSLKPINKDNVENAIYVSHRRDMAGTLAEFVYVVRRGLWMGVQLQGTKYRQFVMAESHNKAKELFDRLKTGGMWFKFSHVAPGQKDFPKNKEFGTFEPRIFLHRYVEASSELKISRIIDCMIKDAESINQLIEKKMI